MPAAWQSLSFDQYLRGVKPLPATTLTLSTTELLEQVLLHLPLPKIFAFQRISRTWRTTVNDSVVLQTALFLRPPQLTHKHWKFPHHFFLNPDPGAAATWLSFALTKGNHGDDVFDRTFFLNPLIHAVCEVHDFTIGTPRTVHLKANLEEPLRRALEFGLTLRLPEPKPLIAHSWRQTRLFASRNRLVRVLGYSLSYGGLNGALPVTARGLAPETLGELIDTLMKLQRFCRGVNGGTATFAIYPMPWNGEIGGV